MIFQRLISILIITMLTLFLLGINSEVETGWNEGKKLFTDIAKRVEYTHTLISSKIHKR